VFLVAICSLRFFGDQLATKNKGRKKLKRRKTVTVAIRRIGLLLTVYQGRRKINPILSTREAKMKGDNCSVFECCPGEYRVKDNGPGRKVSSGTLIVGKDGEIETRGWRLMNRPIVLRGNP